MFTPQVSFSAQLGNHTIDGVAINPGDWFGKVWILEIGGSYTASYFAVEADNASDAIDVLADSDYGHLIKVDPADIDDIDPDDCHYSDCGEPLDLDNLAIHQLPVRYFGPFLWSAGLTPQEYGDWSAKYLDGIWGPELSVSPDNPFKYHDIRFPIPTTIKRQYITIHVNHGDIVKWGESIGRAIGITTDGNLVILGLSANMQSVYLRIIPVADITEVARPNPLLNWFATSTMADSQTALSLCRHGSLSAEYIGKYLDASGELRQVRPAFHYSAIQAASAS